MKEWYDKKYFASREGYERAPRHKNGNAKKILRSGAKSVLDVGCGHGFLIDVLNKKGVFAVGMDFSKWAGTKIPNSFIRHDATIRFPFPDKCFDLVYSADFFEHLEEKDIDFVASEMERVGKTVWATICFKKDAVKDGEVDTHLTVRPRAWWEQKIPNIKILE